MATFMKLRDGAWGVMGQRNEIIPGNRVTVTKQNGSTTTAIVGRILWDRKGKRGATIAPNLSTVPQTSTHTKASSNSGVPNNGNGHQHQQGASQPPQPTRPTIITTQSLSDLLTPGKPEPKPETQAQPQLQRNSNSTQQTNSQTVSGTAGIMCPDRLKSAAQKLGRVVMLQYDIPETSNFPNPSGSLRRIGIRVTKSVWAIQESRIPWPLVDAMREANVTWHIVQFADNEAPKLVSLALASLQAELKQAETALNKSIADAGEALDSNTEASDHRAVQRYHQRIQAATKRCEKLREDLQEAAKEFGIGLEMSDRLKHIRSITEGINMIAHQRATAYMRMRELANGTDMETAANDGSIPAQVLADYLMEQGHDVSNESEVFSD